MLYWNAHMTKPEVGKLYVGATRQNDGKTMVSLGLLHALGKRVNHIGYMKPVGQQYVEIDGSQIDKDAVLMHQAYHLGDHLEDMSPIAVRKGFTEDYIVRGRPATLAAKILKASRRLCQGKDLVLVEGTGHAGVGSVFDTSNSDVAKLLGAKVIIISCGGIGRPIDEIMLNITKFQVDKVDIVGVIFNKVRAEKYDKVNRLVRLGMKRKKIPVLGVIPFVEMLSNPTLKELLEDLGGELICGEKGLKNQSGKMVIGAMPPRDALDYFTPNCLLITPGNRDDLILAAMSTSTLDHDKSKAVSGIVLTCGIEPHPNILHLVKQTDIPIILVKHDTFTTASKIYGAVYKLRAEETAKVQECGRLVEQYVDIDQIMQAMK